MKQVFSSWIVFALALGTAMFLSTGGSLLETSSSVTTMDVDVTAIPCPTGYDNHASDDVCFAYDGRIPGPTWVFQEGDDVEITIHNKIGATIDNATSDPAVADALRNARISLHRHGIITPNGEDGVASPAGTNIVDSTVPAGTSHTYPFVTAFSGAWHYHDHTVLVPDATGATARGLYGSFVTLPAGVTDTHAFGLHLRDEGPQTGPEWSDVVPAGERIDLVVTTLGDLVWDVQLNDPNGGIVDRFKTGPGVAHGFSVDSPIAGNYTWTASNFFVPGSPFSGQVVVA